MEGETGHTPTLAEIREGDRRQSAKESVYGWLKKHVPWLVNWKSLFWYFVFIYVVGIIWNGYAVFTHDWTSMYGWDYTSQFISLAYHFYDVWHAFFATGQFPFYDAGTFFGVDSVGSNAYYGLFDPFVFLINFFPRNAVPHIFFLATFLKGAVGALCMRAFLKYMGISEATSRIGGLAFAYCGFFNFMVGFPNVVSCVSVSPLIFLGIEKVLKERKPTTLALGLALMGIISFLYLVIFCIFGVMYAVWRYFWTITKRNAKENWMAIAYGFLGFAVGLMLCAWTLLPSLRESSLSGRTTSVGALYIQNLSQAFANVDIGTVFARLFEMVGDNQGRELMGLVSFFYPTCGYLYLPVFRGSAGSTGTYYYDSWIASLFVYTPMVIMFIYDLVGSVRKRDWQHLVGFSLMCYLVFTTFAYYFFFVFSGDGYGRWYIVIEPLIIYFACRGLDSVAKKDPEKKDPSWQLPLASLLAVFMTVLTYVIAKTVLDGQSIDNWNHLPSGYFKTYYIVPAKAGSTSLVWMIYYQIAIVVAECVVIYLLRNKKWLHYAIAGFLVVEIAVAGNTCLTTSYLYNFYGDSSYSWYGGATERSLLQDAAQDLKAVDPSPYYRVYSDSTTGNNSSLVAGYNGSSAFHSLYNFDLARFLRHSGIARNQSYGGETYGGHYLNQSWSGYYGNKRAAFDQATGFKYYIIKNEGYEGIWDLDDESYAYYANVPFGSTCVYKNDLFRIYQSPYSYDIGHGVTDVYLMGKKENSVEEGANQDNFYTSGNTIYTGDIIRNELIYSDGAIIEDEDEERLLESKPGTEIIEEAPSQQDMFSARGLVNLSGKVSYSSYVTTVGFNASDPGAFLKDGSDLVNFQYGPFDSATEINNNYKVVKDRGKYVWSPSSGTYFNEDEEGAYFILYHPTDTTFRVYMIGDTYDSEGNLTGEYKLLCYEYWSYKNYKDHKEGTNPIFGMYAPGRVRYIVFSEKGSSSALSGRCISAANGAYMMEKSDFDANFDKQGDTLKVTSISTDEVRFTSSFAEKTLCQTILGYDAGWRCEATYTDESGNEITEDVEMFKLDGGLVGFLALEGDVSYRLYYETPYIRAGTYLAMGGIAILAAVNVAAFTVAYLKKKKELGLSYDGTPSKEA